MLSNMPNDYMTLMSPWHEHVQDGQKTEAPTDETGHDHVMAFRSPSPTVTATRQLVTEAHEKMQSALSAELLGYVHAQSSVFFEQLVIDLVVALGYGGRRRGRE